LSPAMRLDGGLKECALLQTNSFIEIPGAAESSGLLLTNQFHRDSLSSRAL
jgi:hypothetical protein